MARIKVKPECRLKSWADVDDTFKRLADCERIMMDLESRMNAELDIIKKRYSDMSAPVQERIDHYSTDIQQFVMEHRDDIENKTKDLNFGRVGFRINTKIKYLKGVKAKDVVDSPLRLRLGECIKITRTPILNALKKQPADVLDKIGVTLKKIDEFWLETKREEIHSAADQEVQP